MPYRKIVFAENETYHILNHGVADSLIFISTREFKRFWQLIDYYRFDTNLSFSHWVRLDREDKKKTIDELKKGGLSLTEIYAHCLMPNHFHLLIKQLLPNGISKMLSNVQNSYVRYFNLRNNRKGPLFESMFKAVRIETDEQFLHVSRYIHLNPSTSYLVKIKDLDTYRWSSFPEYLGLRKAVFTNTQPILKMLSGKENYKKFVYNQAKYQRELDKIKRLVLEN